MRFWAKDEGACVIASGMFRTAVGDGKRTGSYHAVERQREVNRDSP